MNNIFLRYAMVIFLLLGFAGGTMLPVFTRPAHGLVAHGDADQTESAAAGSCFATESDANDYLTGYRDLFLAHSGSRAVQPEYARVAQVYLPTCYLAIVTPPPDSI